MDIARRAHKTPTNLNNFTDNLVAQYKKSYLCHITTKGCLTRINAEG